MQKPLRKHSRTSRAPGGIASYRSVIRQDASRVRSSSVVYGAAANLLIPIHRLATLHEPAQSFARFTRAGQGLMPRQLNGYLNVKEAAAYLGASPATLRNWDRAGKLTPCRHPVNGYRLYRKEDLERILRQV